MTTKTTAKTNARLIEVFSAIQGEGLNVGMRQIFIRFALCDLRCHFCDSSHTWSAPQTCRIERSPGSRNFEVYSNPVSLNMLVKWIERQNIPRLHDSISLTGGEPLLHAAFFTEFLPKLKSSVKLPIYLETGGHRPQQLVNIISHLDYVGMDFKLPSTSGENYWQQHEEFLRICNDSQTEVFVKIIISSLTKTEELQRCAKIIAGINSAIAVFLQPVTPLDNGKSESKFILAPSPSQVLNWQALMKQFLKEVRAIPQTHKMINQL
ncbi:MAG: 7-carboxy-7-deazaguanine synthase QueE [Cyanobacteria bacterium P01_A01_bin.84]